MKEFNNQFTAVHYDDELHIIRIKLEGFIPTQPYREGLEKMLEIAKRYRCNNWLYDTRTFAGAKPEDIAWASHEYVEKSIQQMKATGITTRRKSASLLADNVFANFQTQKATKEMEAVSAQIDARFFNNEKEALHFLSQHIPVNQV